MKFFEELKEMIGDNTITISVTADGGRLILVCLPKPKGDKPLDGMVPLCISGTPEQLEAGFMTALASSVQVLNGLKTNLEAVKESKVEPETKPTTTKPGKKGKTKTEEPKKEEEPSGVEGLPFDDGSGDPDDPFGDVEQQPQTLPHAVETPVKPVHTPTAARPSPAPAAAAPVQQSLMPETPVEQPKNEADDER